jgi:GTP-binding protein
LDEGPDTVNSSVAPALPLVAIVGRANVGKSTLFNRLLHERRSLVHDRPGVTRDRVVGEASIEGRDVLLVDTGGLEPEAEQGIPAAVRTQVQRAIEDAAVILFVVDLHTGLLPQDETIANLLRRARAAVIVVANKADSPRHEDASAEFHRLGFPLVVNVSAEHRRGLVDLEVSIASLLPPPAPPVEAADSALRLAIVGRPNVGKSSLVNRLVGEGVAVVSETPGTTRDATDHRLRVGDAEVVLIDTAGLRRAGRRSDALERGSALMALRGIERASVALLVADASEGVTEQDARIARLARDRGRPLAIALNKWDLVRTDARRKAVLADLERRLHFVADAPVLRISARTGAGCARILPAMIALARQASRVVSTSELNAALRDAVDALQPPMSGRRRPKLLYATQTSSDPFQVLVFASHPESIPESYRRYLQSYFRRRFDLGSAPVRVVLRARRAPEDGGPRKAAGRRARR